MSGRFDSRSDSRKRGRSRSPEARRDRNERNSRTVTHQKSKNKNDNFKLPHPREPKDKIAQILQVITDISKGRVAFPLHVYIRDMYHDR